MSGKSETIRKPVSVADGMSFDGGGACFSGGIALEGFERQPDGVYRCDLTACGIKAAPMRSRGFGRNEGGGHSELFIGNKPCNISQYPKKGLFLHISDFNQAQEDSWGTVNGKLESGFFYEDEDPKRWAESNDIWVHGYWSYDWANSYEHIDVLDRENGFIRTKPPYGCYQYRKGQRFYFLNIREEVTEPGDYCIDYEENAVYFRPFAFDDNLSDVRLSIADFPCFELENIRGAVIENCEIRDFTSDAITVKNCRDIVFRNCRIHNIGGRAACVTDSHYVVFDRCEIFDTGDGGVDIRCGDRASLTPGRCGVTNSHLHHIAKWSRTYTPPIHLRGVGLFAENNVIHDCPHTAVMFWGNDMKITGNEIYRVVTETGDAGAVYTGRDFTFRGNVVSDNLICLTGGVGMGAMGIYNDDCVSGTVMENNVFYKVSRALFLGGGRDFVAVGNLCVDCAPGAAIDCRGADDHPVWRNQIIQTMKNSFYNITPGVSGDKPPYITRYPELAAIDGYYKSKPEPKIPASGLLKNNVFCGRGIEYSGSAECFRFTEDNNRTVSECELEKAVPPALYAKYLKARRIEEEIKEEIK